MVYNAGRVTNQIKFEKYIMSNGPYHNETISATTYFPYNIWSICGMDK